MSQTTPLDPRLLYLRRMGSSLHLTIPVTFVREYDLETGAPVFLLAEPDGIKLKFIKQSALHELAGVHGEAAA